MRLSIRTWMLLTSILATVPLLLFTALMMQRIAVNQQLEDQRAVRQRTAAAASAIKERLDRAVAVLQAIAASDAALRGEFGALHAQARRIAASYPYEVSISVSRADGSVLLSTSSPMGVSLPASAATALERTVFEGETVVTPVFHGAMTGRLVVVVAIPLRIAKHPPLSLRMSLPTEAIKAVLAEQRWPEEWIVSAIDQRGMFVARVPDPQNLVGTPASESLRQAIAQGRQDLFEAITRDNTPVIGHAAPVPGTGWHVAVGVPQALFHQGLRRTLTGLLVAGVACLALGTIGAVAVSRLVGRQVQQLARSSGDTADSLQRPPMRPSLVAEVEAVSGALAEAHDKQQALHHQLASARLDTLTGLATRQLFWEKAGDQVERRRSDPEHSVALLFVDLDGFKRINDEQGHEVGDSVLAQVAQAIRRVVRAEDVVGRFGGDEFVICLCADRGLIETICRSVAARLIEQVNAIGYGIGCSIGIATMFGHRQSLDGLLTAADAAMLRAKRAGKNTFVFSDKDAGAVR